MRSSVRFSRGADARRRGPGRAGTDRREAAGERPGRDVGDHAGSDLLPFFLGQGEPVHDHGVDIAEVTAYGEPGKRARAAVTHVRGEVGADPPGQLVTERLDQGGRLSYILSPAQQRQEPGPVLAG